jgi:hypothetical protein
MTMKQQLILSNKIIKLCNRSVHTDRQVPTCACSCAFQKYEQLQELFYQVEDEHQNFVRKTRTKEKQLLDQLTQLKTANDELLVQVRN